MFRRLAAISLISAFAFAAAAKADEPSAAWIMPADSVKMPSGDWRAWSSKAPLDKEKEAVRLAMCGIEAESGNAGLDAGLIDFKTPDPHAVGRSYEDLPQAGRNVPDYRASVFLGVTLGYHF